jgi:DNA-binding NtrC family response regulator
MSSADERMTQVTRAAQALRERFDWQKIGTYRLWVRRPDGSEMQQELAGRIVRVGSRPENDLVLDDPTVSRIHFEIVADHEGFRLRDLESMNGTVVDGYRVHDLYLKPGSRIHVGRSEIVFEPLGAEAERPLAREGRFGPLVGKSAAMRELFATLERVARSDATVLVEGETGTGKELIARALHEASERAGGPFVVVDSAAIPRDLFESQLFGHERGAFTGAEQKRVGLLEEADGGTLVLDELGELPLALQPKLLRALEAREVVPVGSNEPRRVDVRLVASTNRDLAAEVNRGAFRDDLYYRLAVVRVVVPPLRERPDDVRPLVEQFVAEAAGARGRAILDAIDEPSWRALEAHPWPGNVRELRNMVGRSLALAGPAGPRFEPVVDARPGGPASRPGTSVPPPRPRPGTPVPAPMRPFLEQKREIVAEFEKNYLLGMLERHGGNISRAAADAGLDRMYFKRLLKKYQA